jgi:hypothetical protein
VGQSRRHQRLHRLVRLDNRLVCTTTFSLVASPALVQHRLRLSCIPPPIYIEAKTATQHNLAIMMM